MSSVIVFMPFHEKKTIRAFSKLSFIEAVNLNSLTIEGRPIDSSLAESRFFVSPPPIPSMTDWVGLCSPRWEKKWPRAPRVADLEDLVMQMGDSLGYAPGLQNLVRDEAEVLYPKLSRFHPGIDEPLTKVVENFGLDLPLETKAPWANNFIVHRDLYSELLVFWREVYQWFGAQSGHQFSFGFECWSCGWRSNERIGRYGKERLAAFFYERVTMLFFAVRKIDWLEVLPRPKPQSYAQAITKPVKRHIRLLKKRNGKCPTCRNATLPG